LLSVGLWTTSVVVISFVIVVPYIFRLVTGEIVRGSGVLFSVETNVSLDDVVDVRGAVLV